MLEILPSSVLISLDHIVAFSRLVVGVVMIYFGWPKIKDLKGNAEDFNDMGFKPGWMWGTPIAVLEFFGGIAMIFGLLVPLVALLFAMQMLVGTIWKVASKKKFPHYSYDVVLLALCLFLIALGPGSYAIASFLS